MKKHMVVSRNHVKVNFLCGGSKTTSMFYDNHGQEVCKKCLAVFNKGLDKPLKEID